MTNIDATLLGHVTGGAPQVKLAYRFIGGALTGPHVVLDSAVRISDVVARARSFGLR